MPTVRSGGKTKHYSYTPKGRAAYNGTEAVMLPVPQALRLEELLALRRDPELLLQQGCLLLLRLGVGSCSADAVAEP